ncbi:sporulation histidine kinase inhibitor Sda [Bacillus sp. ISL-40]|nr:MULTISPECIES: sporulation histidine kinase inhibitor Sda [unclassified Bacillus (in: firmicutes)]MBT2696577.1 sporulation histidine kinase inhibitor Sda [Bacillus sp. ISL-40]MBT2723738.1 sporulation histidine kinase inhibitor Sda [Bacillus sp. ISL-46]MBT2740778.1 sporulation histidine kinase inhibitor Sda [Bacillus sp. ISL-77]
MGKLDLEELREVYEKALKINISPNFINLIKNELNKRK